MKHIILKKYTELSQKSHLHFAEQVKTYLSTPEEDKEEDAEVIDLPFPGNATYNFNTRLKDEDMQPLSISFMSYVSNIRHIDLSYNILTDKGIAILSKLLEYADNLQSLNLKGNQIGDNGCESLSRALKNKTKLSYFNINTNVFGNLGLMSINELLYKNEALKHLNVGCNRYDWDGIISITSALKTTNTNLEVLNIDDPEYKIQDQHFFAHFGKMFLSNTGLKKLSLRSHMIRWEAVKILFHHLRNNSSLLVLDLSGNQVCFQSMIYILDYLSKKSVLRSLNLSHNKLYDHGVKLLGEGLKTNTTLEHLDVTSNKVTDVGFVEFGTRLMENKTLKSLKCFWENSWGANSIKVFNDYLAMKGSDFYPDFTIYEDEQNELNIAYLETHMPNEQDYLVE